MFETLTDYCTQLFGDHLKNDNGFYFVKYMYAEVASISRH